jgi:hypothetical protein
VLLLLELVDEDDVEAVELEGVEDVEDEDVVPPPNRVPSPLTRPLI